MAGSGFARPTSAEQMISCQATLRPSVSSMRSRRSGPALLSHGHRVAGVDQGLRHVDVRFVARGRLRRPLLQERLRTVADVGAQLAHDRRAPFGRGAATGLPGVVLVRLVEDAQPLALGQPALDAEAVVGPPVHVDQHTADIEDHGLAWGRSVGHRGSLSARDQRDSHRRAQNSTGVRLAKRYRRAGRCRPALAVCCVPTSNSEASIRRRKFRLSSLRPRIDS